MRVLLCLLILLAGCQANNKAESSLSDSLQHEKESIQQQNEQLRKENEQLLALKQRQEDEEQARKEEEEARKAEEEKTFPSDAVLGAWKVKLSCTESDCFGGKNVGDVFTQGWTIDYVGGQNIITVTSNLRNTNSEYRGTFDGKYLRGHYEAQTTEWTTRTTAKVTLTLRMKDDHTLVGTRKVVNADPCAITYEIEAVKD